jgi:tetratricopeptide (TPR) repeat protein/outer membrane biosynthesis protein TonB
MPVMPETRSELGLEGRLTRFSGESISSDVALQTTIDQLSGNSARYMELASALIQLAVREHEGGNYQEAEAFFGKALVVGERALGPDHPALLPALTGLGAARMSRGASAEADSTLARALTICESRIGADEPELVILLNDLVRLCLKQSLHAFAEPALLRLLAIKRTKGEARPEVATVLASLAFVHQSLGRHQSAEQLWTRVVEIREQTLAPNHLSVATALEHLADACTARGKISQALQLLQRAQLIREVTLGKDHSSLRASRERVADLQLQASEDILDVDDSFAALPAPSRPRITASHGWTVPDAVVMEQKLPPVSAEPSVMLPAREELLPSLENGIAITSQQPAEAVPYREMILSMQSELEPGEEKVSLSERAAVLFASVADLVRKRDRSVVTGVAAMTLVLVVVAGSRAWGKMEDSAVVGAPVDGGVPTALPAYSPAPTRPPVAADESLNAAAARSLAAATVLNPSRSRVAERTVAARTRSNSQSVAPGASLPKAVNVNLDSVVSTMSAAANDVGAAILSPPSLVAAAGTRPSFRSEERTPARRARLIGAMPVPRYPIQLAQIGGEVRIRFMVDAVGQPMMGTFSVISSPDALLTTAVRNVVPRMRFEPARTEGPESKPTSEWVETVFRFER